MPKPFEFEKYCKSYFKKTIFADNWESWELKKGTNIANSGIIYDDELKSQWKDLFPNDMHLALKSFVNSFLYKCSLSEFTSCK